MSEPRIHVGVDATSWGNDRGFGRFTREIMTALAARDTGFRYTLVFDQPPEPGTVPEGFEVISAETERNLQESAVGTTSRSLSYLWKVGKATRQANFDVFYFPAVYSYFPILTRTPIVVCYHDTTAERFPKLLFPTRLNHRLWQVKTALARFQTDRAMTVSEASARDLEHILRIPRDKIDVVTEAADPVFRVIEDPAVPAAARARYDIPEEAALFVYVGGMNPHKNLLGFLKSLPRVIEQRPETHLAIVGSTTGKGFWDNVPELQAFVENTPALKERVRFTGYISDPELVELLNGATALVFPSLWEGFGLPAVEAMSCGVPVLASRRGSLPEVVGDAGLLFDPESQEEMAASLLQVLGEKRLRAQLAKTALARARTFTWDRGAELAEVCFRRCHEEATGKR